MPIINGGAGHDTLTGGADNDIVNGLGGNGSAPGGTEFQVTLATVTSATVLATDLILET